MGRDKRDITDAEQIADLLRIGMVTRTQLMPQPYPEVVGPEIIFKHIDYMCQLHGDADHVGYGSDWIPDMNGTMKLVAAKADTYPDMGMPPGTTKRSIEMYGPTANPARIMPAVVDQLLGNGYSEEDIRKFLGGNMMRVFEEVWNGADVKIDDAPAFHDDWR
jgi:membrane dipeptidase